MRIVKKTFILATYRPRIAIDCRCNFRSNGPRSLAIQSNFMGNKPMQRGCTRGWGWKYLQRYIPNLWRTHHCGLKEKSRGKHFCPAANKKLWDDWFYNTFAACEAPQASKCFVLHYFCCKAHQASKSSRLWNWPYRAACIS